MSMFIKLMVVSLLAFAAGCVPQGQNIQILAQTEVEIYDLDTGYMGPAVITAGSVIRTQTNEDVAPVKEPVAPKEASILARRPGKAGR